VMTTSAVSAQGTSSCAVATTSVGSPSNGTPTAAVSTIGSGTAIGSGAMGAGFVATGSGTGYRFTTTLSPNIATIGGKGGFPYGRVRVYGDTAISTYSRRFELVARSGAPASDELVSSHVWLKRDGRWQLVFSQTTRVPRLAP